MIGATLTNPDAVTLAFDGPRVRIRQADQSTTRCRPRVSRSWCLRPAEWLAEIMSEGVSRAIAEIRTVPVGGEVRLIAYDVG
jgi:hypothetical protein